ncbi:hypothetical protein [Calothrix sp. 336/3]|uniref:hypothetical protein n=1 Tax=Calothrix sp. 336/3 TaxID=1337936 RepID=UPI0006245B21|nr:hypothetical protein [Calothrix sp. 336/3]AKG24033.1 hypothetical protein IJ00_24400 [Calothrix sp. 336/3]
MSSLLPPNSNISCQSDNSKTTEEILDIVKNVTATLSNSDTVELAKTGSQTAENIFNILVKTGGKPVAIILAISILIASTAIPIFALSQYHKEPFPVNKTLPK